MNVIVGKTWNVLFNKNCHLFKASYYIAACILLGYIIDENDREFIIARGRGRPKTAGGALTR